MREISIPYGKTMLTGHVDEKNFLGSFHAALPAAARDETSEVSRALDAPFASPGLEELASRVNDAVVIASDHTRPVPSRILMPQILARLRKGNPSIAITILIATGFHRGTTGAELLDKFGPEIVRRERIVVHDSSDESGLVRIGTLPSGGELIVNRLAAEASLLVAEGFIEPHFFAGFSGGRKSVLPGIASRRTVLANHCAEFIRHPKARTGVLDGNPIHEDMLFAAKTAKLAFIVNVVINAEKRIVAAFAGDPVAAHRAGTEYLSRHARIEVPEADIVITGNGGYPLDQNVYQSVKGMTAGEAVCREGGVIILCASCCDGHGGESFYRHLAGGTPQQILDEVSRIPRDRTEPDQWEYQILARILVKHTVIVVTKDCDHRMLHAMHLTAASSVDEALAKAFELCGPDAKVAAIPDGVSVIARMQQDFKARRTPIRRGCNTLVGKKEEK